VIGDGTMPIRPIDMQTILPRIQKIDAAKPKVVNKIANELAQNQAGTTKEVAVKLNKVNILEQKESNRVKNNDQGKNKQSKDQKKKKKDDDDDDTEPQKMHLDIKV